MSQIREAYPRDETLTAIILGYQNKAMIADRVMPRTSPLDSPRYKYQRFAPGQFAHVPDTTVGRRTQVNEVEFRGETVYGETQEYALKHGFIPRDYDGVKNPEAKRASATTALSGLLDLAREIRVANAVMNTANYGTNYAAVTATDKFTNNDADVVKLIRNAILGPRIRPNVMILGQKEWSALASHPRVLAAVTRAFAAVSTGATIQTAGIAAREEVARLFELQEIIVGESEVASSFGDNAVFSPTWSGGVAFHRLDPTAISGVSAGMNNGMTWGFTAHFDKFANRYSVDSEGTRGVEYIRVVDDCEERVISPDCGMLLTGVI